jgi:hypothetical protein
MALFASWWVTAFRFCGFCGTYDNRAVQKTTA